MDKKLAVSIASVVFLAVLGGMPSRGQDAGVGMTSPKMMPGDADPDWDVVAVKPSAPSAQSSPFDMRGSHIIIGNQTVESMLRLAYGLQSNQIVGGPDWIRTKRFDAEGLPNVVGQPDVKQFCHMLQKLLVERFSLVAHTEQRSLLVYALKVAPRGPRLTKSTGDPNGLPHETDNQAHSGGEMAFGFKNTSMSEFTLDLLFVTDRPVVDQTGLTGKYDFRLEWTFDEARAPTDGTAPPSLFSAIQEQLGLKIDAVKAMADVLVVDKVKELTAN